MGAKGDGKGTSKGTTKMNKSEKKKYNHLKLMKNKKGSAEDFKKGEQISDGQKGKKAA